MADDEIRKVLELEIGGEIKTMKLQAVWDIVRSVVPQPTQDEAIAIADSPSKQHEGEPRWHDFLHPVVRKIIINLNCYLNHEAPKFVLTKEESALVRDPEGLNVSD